jgi:hypothetical protein
MAQRDYAQPAAAGASSAPSLSLLTLNIHHRRDLAGLAGLNYDLHPSIIFLQEVHLLPPALTAVATSMGLTAWISEAGQRTMAVLSKLSYCHQHRGWFSSEN